MGLAYDEKDRARAWKIFWIGVAFLVPWALAWLLSHDPEEDGEPPLSSGLCWQES